MSEEGGGERNSCSNNTSTFDGENDNDDKYSNSQDENKEGEGLGEEEQDEDEEEVKNRRRKEEENVKLFVGQVPKQMTEEELMAIFSEFAVVDRVNVIKDKVTKASRGCCFLICPSREEADKAVDACHNKKTLSGASSPLQVKYADGELERLEHKLFVGMLPKNVSESELTALFSNYGTIKDLQILRGSQQTSKGCAFLKYETKDQAVAALESLNGKQIMEGSTVPLVVKWADTEKERQARRAQKAQSQSSSHSNTNSQPNSLFGALPMSYVSHPYNGYGYQATGSYGLMPYRMRPMQNQLAFHSLPHAVRGGIRPELTTGMAARSYGLPHPSYVGSGYPGVPGLRYPLSYHHGGMLRHQIGGASPGPLSPAATTNSTVSNATTSSGGQIEGPPGANLFIYHIPQEYGDQELALAFHPFGNVLSAKVFVDKPSGASKCFGFVSFDSPVSAQAAISGMNGRHLGGKKLKVQLKRDNKQSQPY